MRSSTLFLIALLTLGFAAPARARTDALDGPTTALLVGIPAALLLWDGYLAIKDARTESMLLRDAAWRVSAVPYAVGFVCGHWFWNRTEPSPPALFFAGLGSLAAVTALDLLTRQQDRPTWKFPGLWFAAGFGVGALTWGQRW